MANAVDNAIRAQGAAIVKPHQVQAMIIAARRAYKVQNDLGLVDEDVTFDLWRRATLHDVTGAGSPSSFRAVTQRDYPRVIAYFEELAGDAGGAHSCASVERDEWRRACWTLSCTEETYSPMFGGIDDIKAYTDALFRDIHKTDRISATARQVWAVIITLKKRAKSRLHRMYET